MTRSKTLRLFDETSRNQVRCHWSCSSLCVVGDDSSLGKAFKLTGTPFEQRAKVRAGMHSASDHGSSVDRERQPNWPIVWPRPHHPAHTAFQDASARPLLLLTRRISHNATSWPDPPHASAQVINEPQRLSFKWRSNCALMATMMVDALIATAPTLIGRSNPQRTNSPPATGIATRL